MTNRFELRPPVCVQHEDNCEVWVTFDQTTRAFELWAGRDFTCLDRIGGADTMPAARDFAQKWVSDRKSVAPQ